MKLESPGFFRSRTGVYQTSPCMKYHLCTNGLKPPINAIETFAWNRINLPTTNGKSNTNGKNKKVYIVSLEFKLCLNLFLIKQFHLLRQL
jgi:hypothetical protein